LRDAGRPRCGKYRTPPHGRRRNRVVSGPRSGDREDRRRPHWRLRSVLPSCRTTAVLMAQLLPHLMTNAVPRGEGSRAQPLAAAPDSSSERRFASLVSPGPRRLRRSEVQKSGGNPGDRVTEERRSWRGLERTAPSGAQVALRLPSLAWATSRHGRRASDRRSMASSDCLRPLGWIAAPPARTGQDPCNRRVVPMAFGVDPPALPGCSVQALAS
jgi:hypothetical protein